MPGNRFVVVQGGIEEPLTISTVSERAFRKIPICGTKKPMDTLKEKVRYYFPKIGAKSNEMMSVVDDDNIGTQRNANMIRGSGSTNFGCPAVVYG